MGNLVFGFPFPKRGGVPTKLSEKEKKKDHERCVLNSETKGGGSQNKQ